MQAAHEYYLQHATSEVGHRSPICSPCLRLLWAAWSADRSPGRQPDGTESDHREPIGRDFFFLLFRSDRYFRRVAQGNKRIAADNSRHSWEMIGSTGSLPPTTRL